MNSIIIQQALKEIFSQLNYEGNITSYENYTQLKSRLSSKILSEKLSIPETRLVDFEEALRQYYQFKDNPNKSRISFLRVSLWLEVICKKLNIYFKIEEVISNEELAIKQVRALELIFRDLVSENLGGNDNVLSKLRSLFKFEIVEKWINCSDESGILSGTTFSELSSIMLDKNIFLGIEDIFRESNLIISKQTRDSLRFILEDIRIIRNYLAHNKKISNLQIEVLNTYYNEIASIIKASRFTNINPDSYLDLKFQNIEDYLKKLKVENEVIVSGISIIKNNTEEIKLDGKKNKKRLLLVLSGVLFLIILGSISIYKIQNQTDNIDVIKNIVENNSEPESKEKIRFEESVKSILFNDYTKYRNSNQYIEDSIKFHTLFYERGTLDGIWIQSDYFDSLDREWRNMTFPQVSEFSYYMKAWRSSQNNDVVSASNFIDTALVLNKNMPQLYYRKRFTIDNIDSSISLINKAISFSGKYSWFYLKYRGDLYDTKNDYINAVIDYQNYLNSYPIDKDPDLRIKFMLIGAYVNANLKEKARLELKKITKHEMEILKEIDIDMYTYFKNKL